MTTPTRTPPREATPLGTRAVQLPDSAVIRPIPPVPPPQPRDTTTRRYRVAIVALAVLLVASVGAIVWQQTRVNDANEARLTTQAQLDVAVAETASLQAEVARLDARLARAETTAQGLEREVERLRALLTGSKSQSAEIEAELEQTQAALATAQSQEAAARADSREARAELQAIAGTPLADGRWEGVLSMVGGTQSPPMLAFDEMKLFTGPDAVDAMIADGIPEAKAERCGATCVYRRNPSTEWRIMTIDPASSVTLRSYRLGDGGHHPTTMSLEKFTRIFNGTAPWNAQIAHASYRVTMSGGEVTAIEELNLTP